MSRRAVLSNLDKKLRKFAIPNLTLWLIIGYAIGYVIQMLAPKLMYYLALDPYQIIHGQVWRIFTWVLIPPNYYEGAGMPTFLSFLFIILMLYCCYWIGSILERTWGTVKYNIFIFSGILLTVVFSFLCFGYLCLYYGYDLIQTFEDYKYYLLANNQMVTGMYNELSGTGYFWYSFSTYYINVSLYLVYALTFPERLIYIYFVIPIKMKWLGVVDSLYLLFLLLFGGIIVRFAVIATVLNVLVFYLSNIKGKVLNPYQIHRQNSFKRKFNSRRSADAPKGDKAPKMHAGTMYRHKCFICGKTDISDPDMEFRYCSKCAGSYEYCSVHLFKHTHVRG